MGAIETLQEGFSRIAPGVHRVVRDLDERALTWRADPEANTIAWLVWHIARVQDAQIAPLAEGEEVWKTGGWARRFDLPFDDSASGYGQSSDDVGRVRASAELLVGYVDEVTTATARYLSTLHDGDLVRVVDTRWDPPVTLGVRLVSILADDLQHLGQAGYVRGLAERAR